MRFKQSAMINALDDVGQLRKVEKRPLEGCAACQWGRIVRDNSAGSGKGEALFETSPLQQPRREPGKPARLGCSFVALVLRHGACGQ